MKGFGWRSSMLFPRLRFRAHGLLCVICLLASCQVLAECDANRFLMHLVPSARRLPRPRRIRRLQPCGSYTSTCCLMPTRIDFIQVSLDKS